VGIVRRDGPAGPRDVSLPSGIDVWEIVQVVRNVGNRPEPAARYLEVDVAEVVAAMAHHETDPSDAGARIEAERVLAERALLDPPR
jgi:hypothetical protein